MPALFSKPQNSQTKRFYVAVLTNVSPAVPSPMFEFPMYTVPEDDPGSVPLCVNISVQITQPITYDIVTAQKSPAQAEGKKESICLLF